jgi:hypothetical protein
MKITHAIVGHHNPLTRIDGFAPNAHEINALFGFHSGMKIPAFFTGSAHYNGHRIVCLPSQPDRKHRMMTRCPDCWKKLTVGCLRQHMKAIHGPRIKPYDEIAYWAERRAKADAARAILKLQFDTHPDQDITGKTEFPQ